MGSNADFGQPILSKRLELYQELVRIIMDSSLYYGDAPEVFDYIRAHKLEEDFSEKK